MLTNFAGFIVSPRHTFEVGGGALVRDVSRGLRVCARADGYVVFDFSGWAPGRRPADEDQHGNLEE